MADELKNSTNSSCEVDPIPSPLASPAIPEGGSARISEMINVACAEEVVRSNAMALKKRDFYMVRSFLFVSPRQKTGWFNLAEIGEDFLPRLSARLIRASDL